VDLRSAYNLIQEGDEWKTSFSTMSGHYEYLVMPFGLANAPLVFRDMLGCQIVYINNILSYSTTLEDHITPVRAVLECILADHLFVKPEVPIPPEVGILRLPNQGVRMEDQ
jgi:hypothetical protein